MELDYETNDDTLDEVRKLSSNLRYPNKDLTDQTFLQSLHFADKEAKDTPELKELVLRGLNIRQIPTYLNRLGLDARNIDVRRISDNVIVPKLERCQKSLRRIVWGYVSQLFSNRQL